MIKFLRLYVRLRYWRLRVIRLEYELMEVKAAAKAERYRNLMREDTFVSAAVLGGRGMIGLSPRSGPAEVAQPRRLVEAADPWAVLTGIEKMEFQTEWVQLGLDKGYSMQRIQQDFLQELANRKAFSDEPMN